MRNILVAGIAAALIGMSLAFHPKFLPLLSVRYIPSLSPRISSLVQRRTWSTVLRAQATDNLTGAKFEESDPAKNPQSRPGHDVGGPTYNAPDEETVRKQEKIRKHQESCPRPSWAEEIRTIMAQKAPFAVLSTNSQKRPGYPLGSIVGFAVDDQGRPFFSFSGMSSHTQNLNADQRASLCVTEAAFRGAADARVTLVGAVKKVEGEEAEALRKAYIQTHEGAYWASFGDFSMYRMDPVEEVTFVGGFARAGSVDPKDYAAARPDPLAPFAEPVMTHMNKDHVDALKDYVQYFVGVEGVVDSAQMKRLDRLGFDVRVARGTDSGVLRIPFPAEVRERKAVKEAIVAMSQTVAKLKAEAASSPPPAQ